MRIYVASYEYGYGERQVMGVYSTPQLAQSIFTGLGRDEEEFTEWASGQGREWTRGDHTVTEYELDEKPRS